MHCNHPCSVQPAHPAGQESAWAQGKDALCQWGKQSGSPAPLVLCWLRTADLWCQHFPGTCIRHGPGHQQEISVHVWQQKVPKELAAGDSVRGGGPHAKRYPEAQPEQSTQQTGMFWVEMMNRRVKCVHSHWSDVGHHLQKTLEALTESPACSG